MNKDWLYISNHNQWLMSPRSSYSGNVLSVYSSGYVYNSYGSMSVLSVHPVFYLTSTTTISSGDGSSTNPYILS